MCQVHWTNANRSAARPPSMDRSEGSPSSHTSCKRVTLVAAPGTSPDADTRSPGTPNQGVVLKPAGRPLTRGRSPDRGRQDCSQHQDRTRSAPHDEKPQLTSSLKDRQRGRSYRPRDSGAQGLQHCSNLNWFACDCNQIGKVGACTLRVSNIGATWEGSGSTATTLVQPGPAH